MQTCTCRAHSVQLLIETPQSLSILQGILFCEVSHMITADIVQGDVHWILCILPDTKCPVSMKIVLCPVPIRLLVQFKCLIQPRSDLSPEFTLCILPGRHVQVRCRLLVVRMYCYTVSSLLLIIKFLSICLSNLSPFSPQTSLPLACQPSLSS